jgi:hypothetical protein
MGTVSSLRQQGVVQVVSLKKIVLLIYFYKIAQDPDNLVSITKYKIKFIACCLAEQVCQKLFFVKGKTKRKS